MPDPTNNKPLPDPSPGSPPAGPPPGPPPAAPPAEKISEKITSVGLAPPPGKTKRTRIIVGVLGLLLILISIPVTIFVVEQRQELRKEAAEITGNGECTDSNYVWRCWVKVGPAHSCDVVDGGNAYRIKVPIKNEHATETKTISYTTRTYECTEPNPPKCLGGNDPPGGGQVTLGPGDSTDIQVKRDFPKDPQGIPCGSVQVDLFLDDVQPHDPGETCSSPDPIWGIYRTERSCEAVPTPTIPPPPTTPTPTPPTPTITEIPWPTPTSPPPTITLPPPPPTETPIPTITEVPWPPPPMVCGAVVATDSQFNNPCGPGYPPQPTCNFNPRDTVLFLVRGENPVGQKPQPIRARFIITIINEGVEIVKTTEVYEEIVIGPPGTPTYRWFYVDYQIPENGGEFKIEGEVFQY